MPGNRRRAGTGIDQSERSAAKRPFGFNRTKDAKVAWTTYMTWIPYTGILRRYLAVPSRPSPSTCPLLGFYAAPIYFISRDLSIMAALLNHRSSFTIGYLHNRFALIALPHVLHSKPSLRTSDTIFYLSLILMDQYFCEEKFEEIVCTANKK